MKFKNINSEDVLFIKLETVRQKLKFELLDDNQKLFWGSKSKYNWAREHPSISYKREAALWAEFGKISSITTGSLETNAIGKLLNIKTFKGKEPDILLNFKAYILKFFNKSRHLFCAHNGKEFTFPFLGRRYLINQIKLPEKLAAYDKKPWETPYLDTLELWKFGAYKHNISLALLTNILSAIKTSKKKEGTHLVGDPASDYTSQSRKWSSAEKDILNLVNVFLRFKNERILCKEQLKPID
ncbi:3'-5' exonuclease [Eudoraea chungangensis]|uniref:3'-5' exonuclease n=1 Tax=Eudoraea chungangensis TaxID=1481905 RepID=UPI0023EB701B|nr:3'-5' exonuclease [Eudoraea chungangensis]